MPSSLHTSASPTHWLDLAMRIALQGASGPFDLDVRLQVERGSFNAIVGPSGAGKTTLLRLMAGLAKPETGSLRVGEHLWQDSATKRFLATRHRPIAFVFQDYALFPNMSVRENLEYAIGRRHNPADVKRLLEMVGLAQLQDARPDRLSGGQKQRLALIRALARQPEILMLDEPLSALDPEMRHSLQDELKRLHTEFETTTFLVSHDTSEILRLADRVIRLDNGRIIFNGSPAEAFGLSTNSAPGIELYGEHVSGPDADGYSAVLIHHRIHRLRYREMAQPPKPGEPVLLRVDNAIAHTRN
jgi:molybdate transport system ATP-binding protein